MTIDDTARFVSLLTFTLDPSDEPAVTRELQNAIERREPRQKGFIGSVVMLSADKRQLSVVSIWESDRAWSEAQFDREIGQVVGDAVEAAKSYEVRTYQTLKIVRGSAQP